MKFTAQGYDYNIYDMIRLCLPVRAGARWVHGSAPLWQCPLCAASCAFSDTFSGAAQAHSWGCPGRYHLKLLGWWAEVAWPFLYPKLGIVKLYDVDITKVYDYDPKMGTHTGWALVEHFSGVVDGVVVCNPSSDLVANFKITHGSETECVFYVRRAWMEQLRAAFQ